MGIIRVSLVIVVSFGFAACLDRIYSDPVQPADAASDPGDAADMDYVRDRPDTGDADLPDATDPFTESDTVQPDLPDDVVEQDEPVEGDGETCEDPCDPGGTRCSGDSLQTCGDDGCGFGLGAACALTCIDDPEPHCAGMAPSNVDDPSLLCAGSSGLELDPEYLEYTIVIFDTDSGSITGLISGWEAYEVRPAGEGDAVGIVFTVQSQDEPDGPDDPGDFPELAIFSFSDFSAPAGATVIGTGHRALVILSCEEMTIDGIVSVASNTEWEPFDRGTAGPGGGDGGLEPTDDGDGPGGGAVGLRGSDMVDSGGGGGGYGGNGGRAGNIMASWGPGDILLPGGAGGRSYGEAGLIPLIGGSGGGAGAFDSADASAAGGGGGALQLASAVSITIGEAGAADAGGGGGGGGLYRGSSYLGAGGGGGSGGAVLLEAPDISVAGSITAAGGGGGSGAFQHHRGSDGEDGFLAFAGAPGGRSSDDNSGGDGSSPDDPDGVDAEDVIYSGEYRGVDSGGGGGGAGRIRINFFFELAMASGRAHPSLETELFSTGEIELE
ncbi:MAG: hypothetical protein ABIJ56_01690 [Pseudomonadota bacterium]